MANLLIYAFTASTKNPTTTASGLSGSPISGTVVNVAASGDGWASAPFLAKAPASGATTAATAVTQNSYTYFTATPDAGKKLNLATLTLNAGRGGASTPRGLVIRSSVDSYAADLFSADLATYNGTWTAINIDLSGAGFQGLTSAITFRFYVYAPTTGNSVDSDDITLTGAVADIAVGVTPNFIPFFWA